MFQYIVILCMSLLSMVSLAFAQNTEATAGGNQGDFLEQGFFPSRVQQQIINIGTNKQAVGNEVLREGTNLSIDLNGVDLTPREPLIVRFTKFLLRMTIVLAVTMTIFNGVKYILAAGGDGVAQARENLIYIAIGILISMFSVAIIALINSLTYGTLPGIG